MIFSENRDPLFRIMLWSQSPTTLNAQASKSFVVGGGRRCDLPTQGRQEKSCIKAAPT